MLKEIIGLLIAIILLLVIGHMDWSDAQAQSDRYTRMVCSGAWPDYEHQEPDCGEVEQ